MRRVLVVVVGVAALVGVVMPRAEAATPVSVVGNGATVVFCFSPHSCPGHAATVAVDTAGNRGIFVIEGLDQGPVDCVRSATVNGRKGVVVGAKSLANPSGSRLVLVLNEGGRGTKPWAIALLTPKVSGGQCGGPVTAKEAASFNPNCCTVPTTRYVVAGG